jgi:DNA-binding transcriptional LysR family regulator
VDLNQLRSFAAVAKLGHLTRAAETLHLSQPALSGQIKALEENLGVGLFQRSSSGMALTPSGRTLLGQAETILAAVAQMGHMAQGLRGRPTGRLSLGTVLDPGFLHVGELLARALEKYPQIELDLRQVVSNDALAGVRNGTLDASFYFGPSPDADFARVALRDMTYRVVCPVAWESEVIGAAWTAIASRPWILAPEGSSHAQLVLELFHGRAELPARTIESDNESVITNLVESGVGASLVRDEIALASARAGRSVIWPGAQVATRLWLVWAAARDADPLIIAVRDVLSEIWAKLPRPEAQSA